MICDRCNSEMKYFEEGRSCGWRCVTCDNSIATSLVEAIYNDTKEYTIMLLPNDDASIGALKVLSKITSGNFISAKELLKNAPVVLLTSNAVEVRDIKEKLDSVKLNYSISPTFDY